MSEKALGAGMMLTEDAGWHIMVVSMLGAVHLTVEVAYTWHPTLAC